MSKIEIEMTKAREARGWLRGGSAPYQAARHCGFKTVADMMSAIQRMEAAEREEEAAEKAGPAEIHQEAERVEAISRGAEPDAHVVIEDEMHLMAKPVMRTANPVQRPVQAARPAQEKLPDAMVLSQGLQVEWYRDFDGQGEMVRIKTPRRPGCINIQPEQLDELMEMIISMTAMRRRRIEKDKQ